jgi:hypothetical protein
MTDLLWLVMIKQKQGYGLKAKEQELIQDMAVRRVIGTLDYLLLM